MGQYVVYHLHSDLSLLDSTTKFEDYILKAKELGQKAICFTEHGNIMRWIAKKEACDKAGIKYLHGCEVYLTAQLEPKIRDNYHTILIAKNMEGLKEINALVSLSNESSHFYFKPRISFEEFLNISDNVIKISACLASPLSRMDDDIRELSLSLNSLLEEKPNVVEMLNGLLKETGYNLEEVLTQNNIDFGDNITKKNIDYITTMIEEYKKMLQNIDNYSSRLNILTEMRPKLLGFYDFYEVQPHVNSKEQKKYNAKLFELSKQYNKPLIAGTDTHSLNQYKAECRSILQLAKGIEFSTEDDFDLTYKTYDELVTMFEQQDVLPKRVYLQAIENTNVMADMCEEIELDKSFKYPKVYDDDINTLRHRLWDMLRDKIKNGIIPKEQEQQFIENIKTELNVFKKINMCGFMLFMSDLIIWCHQNNIPTGISRGSCGGSCVAYVLDIIDLNPIQWKTVFSRFANEDRKEIGDIDIDFAPNDRDAVYNHMIETFGEQYTAYILAIGTVSDKGCIDEIGRAMHREFPDDVTYSLENIKIIKKEYDEQKNLVSNDLSILQKKIKDKEINQEEYYEEWNNLFKPLVDKYPKIFYYFLGLLDTKISQSMHPCGMVVSPITLADNYGILYRDGKKILQIDMDDVHEVSLVKYDILGLKNVEIIKDACEEAHIPYPKSNVIDWNDQKVWQDMLRCPQGIFQMEGSYAFQMLCEFKPKNIFDMSLVTAALRPSGASYRDGLMKKQFHKNISSLIDDLLKDNYGYLVYQEDVIKFLQQICGLSGSEADNVRRAIARKQIDRLEAALPTIQEGYIAKSGKPRDEALNELQEYIQILIDSSSYMFGYNHSVAYCMIGYLCAYLRCYYTPYFIVSYLNNAANEDDIIGGFEMAKLYNIKILPPEFRRSRSLYVYDEATKSIYKGVSSVKFLNKGATEYLYSLRDNQYADFIDLLVQIEKDSKINSRQMEILIQIQYFKEFGKNKKLLNIYRQFKKLYGRKMLAKDKLEDFNLTQDDIKGAYSKETDKFYTDFDSLLVLKRLLSKEEDVNIPLTEQIEIEMNNIGYLSVTYDVDKKFCYVVSVDTKYSPKIELYSLGNGTIVQCKINKKVFSELPIKAGDIIYCNRFYKKNKQKKTADGWEETSEKEWWLADYELKTENDLWEEDNNE